MTILNELSKYVYEDELIQKSDISMDDEFWNAGMAAEKGFTEEDADPEQLRMGVIVEMEHTTNKDISKKIALDHLSEIPDYYTRLEKMESDAGVDVDEKRERYS